MTTATKNRKTTKEAAPQPIGAAAYLQTADEGVLWTAPSGNVIRIRDLSVIDRALTDSLPSHLMEIVNNIIDRSEALSGNDDPEDDTKLAMSVFGGEERSLRSTLDNLYELGNALCVEAWIQPEVVPTQDDVTDPEKQIPADRIMRDDRIAFITRVFGMDAGESQTLTTFPGEQD